MNNFVPLQDVLNQAANAIDNSAQAVSRLAESSRLDDPDLRTRLLLGQVAKSRRELAEQMRHYSQSTSPTTLQSFVQFAPELRPEEVAGQLESLRTSEQVFERLQEVDESLCSEFDRLSASDQPPQARRICGKTAAVIREQQKVRRMMCQTAQDY